MDGVRNMLDNRFIQPLNPLQCNIEELEELVKSIDLCRAILSKQLFPEKLITTLLYGYCASVDIGMLYALYKYEPEEGKTDILAYPFLFLSVLMLHLATKIVSSEPYQYVFTSSLSEKNQSLLNDTNKRLGNDAMIKSSALQLEELNQTKKAVKQIIMDKKAWHAFSIYNTKPLIKDMSAYVAEFLLPRKVEK